MELEDKKSKDNLKIAAVGFVLIIFVVLVIFFKANYKKEEELLKNEQSQNQEMEKFESITVNDLVKKNTAKGTSIIDIRDAQSFQREHILDSKNISANSLENDPSFLDKNAKHYIVDDLGLTPKEVDVMKSLAEKGYEASYLEGGIYAWKNQLNPLITFGDPKSFTDQAKVTYIQIDELQKALKEDNLYIIDLRTGKEFRDGHLKGAVNMELVDLEKRRKEIPFTQKIILYDSNGLMAFHGAVTLFDIGILNAYSLVGGLSGWKEKGFEIIK